MFTVEQLINPRKKRKIVCETQFNLHKLNVYLLDNKHITKNEYTSLEENNEYRQNWEFNLYFTGKDGQVTTDETLYVWLTIISYFYDVRTQGTTLKQYFDDDLIICIPSCIINKFFD